MTIFEEYHEYLFVIETTVLHLYDTHPDLVDHHVDKAYEALVRLYDKEAKGRKQPRVRLLGLSQDVFDALHPLGELFLGRGRLTEQPVGDADAPDTTDDSAHEADDGEKGLDPITPAEVVMIFKRLRNSIDLWNSTYGRTGYLDYIDSFLNSEED
jgi:hypothetical protein